MKTYNIEGFRFLGRKVAVNGRELVSWSNVWLLTQIIILLQAIQWSIRMPIRYLVISVAFLWLIRACNKF